MFEHLHTTTEVCHLEHMRQTIVDRGFTLGAELGVHHGGSLLYLAEGVQSAGGGSIWGIDNSAKELAIAKRALQERRQFFPDVELWFLEAACPEAITELPDALQFVFVDDYHRGDHVAKELEALMPKMAPDGIIWGHDVCLDAGLGIGEAFMKYGAKIYEEGFGLGEIVL